MNCKIGDVVGYSVRFEDVSSQGTKIKYATDGIVLREAMSDPLLKRYSVIIIDEAHERSLQTDILLGVVKKAQKQRKSLGYSSAMSLKVIVMSATLSVDLFSSYFEDAPILYVQGRSHPVTSFFLSEEEDKVEQDYLWRTMVAVIQVHRANPNDGDILVFLTGEEEIESAVRTLRTVSKSLQNDPDSSGLHVVPLYSALPPEVQMVVFKRKDKREIEAGFRRVVISTNIAETSVTIPNIKYVIDSGKVKQKCYNPKTGVEYLTVINESKAQAKQRSGRAGRLGPGECYCLVSKDKFENNFLEMTEAEILKSNLENVVLLMISLGISNVLEFDFIEKPPTDSVKAAIKLLLDLEAICEKTETEKTECGFQLTRLGKVVCKFPLRPEYALALVYGNEDGCLDDMLSIVSMLSVENLYNRRAAQQSIRANQHLDSDDTQNSEASKCWSKFQHYTGDMVGLLLMYRFVNHAAKKMTISKVCYENFLNPKSVQLAMQIRSQLSKICVSLGWKSTSSSSGFDKVRLCLYKAFRLRLAVLGSEKKYYTSVGHVQVEIHPSSVLHKKLPAAVVYNELVKTTKTYMRGVSVVNEDWVVEESS
ncbi:ATP-dependent RNA helicase DHX33-like isoform X2 [Convolutriloba macropyga]